MRVLHVLCVTVGDLQSMWAAVSPMVIHHHLQNGHQVEIGLDEGYATFLMIQKTSTD